jgi:sensor domain CHASE-containing protein
MNYIEFFDKHQWLPTIITIPVTVAVTVMVAIWQIKLQLKNTLKSQRANKLDELHTEIYKEIA